MLATRTFSTEDQTKFATLSGDFNPIHMDAAVARRTYAGARVVHGMHLLLWLLDIIAARHPEIANAAAFTVRFRRAVYLGERVDADVSECTSESMRCGIFADGAQAVQFAATLGDRNSAAKVIPTAANLMPRITAPRDLTPEEAEGASGKISFAATCSAFGMAFPSAASCLGTERVAALGCSSYLVGMIVPGLHSIYAGLDLTLAGADERTQELTFAVTLVDARLRRLLIEVAGGGLSGSLQTFCRVPPVQQPSINDVAAVVSPEEFRGSIALIVGGSRGLGAVTANLVAAGGGKVIITHAAGALDAQNLAAEINRWGGRCEVIAYDVWRNAEEQLRKLSEPPTHIYYFATPAISKRDSGLCSRNKWHEFNQFYVHGLLALVEAAQTLQSTGFTLFYPSSTYVQDRPPLMTEYAMAKAAGEILCADIVRFKRGVKIITQRLPRVRTDQTASLIETGSADAVQLMLPIIRKMCEINE
jgi:acyl dehydratase